MKRIPQMMMKKKWNVRDSAMIMLYQIQNVDQVREEVLDIQDVFADGQQHLMLLSLKALLDQVVYVHQTFG